MPCRKHHQTTSAIFKRLDKLGIETQSLFAGLNKIAKNCTKKKKKKNDDLQTQSLYTIILIAFYGFKRSSKVSSLCRSDSRFKGTLIKIFIQKSKTRVQKRQLVVFIFL